MVDSALFSSNKSEWGTPYDFVAALKEEFPIILDAAASRSNRVAQAYITEEEDSMKTLWAPKIEEYWNDQGIEGMAHGWVYLNPPYSRQLPIDPWIELAYERSIMEKLNVLVLVPSRTETNWWLTHAWKAHEIRFIKGRLAFIEPDGKPSTVAPFPSALLIYRGTECRPPQPRVNIWDWKRKTLF